MAEAQNRPKAWHRLDNTANLFPVITSKKVANVYRLSLNLAQPVEPDLLQQALEAVLPDFAAFRVRLRRGMFWHYLEANPFVPQVREEDDYPCRAVVPRENNHFLFRVTYFGCRVNLEVYHVLTDGTGGMQFLKALCCRYLILAYPAEFSAEEKARRWFAEHAADTEDSYVANYAPAPKSTYRVGRGFRIKGEKVMLDYLSVTHMYMPVQQVLQHCRGKGVSITHYLIACVAWALYTQQMKKRTPRWPANIFVPVNLRNMFESTTQLNFFASVLISLDFKKQPVSFDDVVAEVKAQFEAKLNTEEILGKISYTVGSGYSPLVRILPLPLKSLGLRLIYEASAKANTLSFSNIGAVVVPLQFEKYITGASLMLSTQPTEPFKCTACSYQDTLTLTFTSNLRSMALQRAVARQLAADGIPVSIQTNGVDYESV